MEKEIDVAVNWWARQLVSDDLKHDNGVFEHNVLAEMATETIPKPTKEELKEFKEVLRTNIKQMLDNKNIYNKVINVDYHPDQYLADAYRKTISKSNKMLDDGFLAFPFKTMMWIEKGEVSVSKGYRAPVEIIYTE